MSRGHEYRDAVAACDHVLSLPHKRAETAFTACAVALTWMGARRVRAACSGDPEAVADRRLIALLAEIEMAAARLEAKPPRGANAAARAEAWGEVTSRVGRLRSLLAMERARTEARSA